VAPRRDLTTGQTSSPELGEFDLGVIENNDSAIQRTYNGLNTQFSYRFNDRLNIGGNWTLSHAYGNFEGENRDSGPLTSSVGEYPEYKAFAQNNPIGDLAIDRRHKARVWAIWDAFNTGHNRLSVSLLQSFFSGTPYGALGGVNTGALDSDDIPAIIPNPGYLRPPRQVSYWFTNRDAFTTDNITSTDLAVNYSFVINGWGREFEVFIQPEILNVFDEQGVIEPNATVIDATNADFFDDHERTRPTFNFNPFTDTPVEGIHYELDSRFGEGVREADFQTPRTFRFSVGFRF
jgi:hypothetical protein